MARFRKKPVVVEAEQWRGPGFDLPAGCYERSGNIYIDTLEGVLHVAPGDWIITGVNGEKYPCKPDIFAKTYEPVEERDIDIDDGC